nr:type II secretion system F family protein [Coxiella endosymbiont of Ornithodoros amblus]
MINSEPPLAQAHALLPGGFHSGQLRQLILTIWRKIKNDLSLSKTLKIYLFYFHTIHREIIHAGEKSGNLGELLKLSIHYEEGFLFLRRKFKN